MSNRLLCKQIRVCVAQLCLVITLFCVGSQSLHAQTPTLDIEVNGDHYPKIEITARCQGLGARAKELFLEVYENNHHQPRSLVTIEAAAPKRLLLLLDISVYNKAALQQISEALHTFNDLCTWGERDQIAVYVPSYVQHAYQLVPLVNWTRDRGAAANLIRQFADAIDNPQAFAQSNPALCDLAVALPRGNTPLLELTRQAKERILAHFTPLGTKGALIIFSDGVDWPATDKFAELGAEIRQTYDLFTVFLADATLKESQNLIALVDGRTNLDHYFALGSSTSLTLSELWRQVGNPQTYKFSYITKSPSPVRMVVKANTDNERSAHVRNSLSVLLQPVQLTIIEPSLGTAFPVTRTQATSATVALTKTIIALVEITWPADRAPVYAQLYYQLNQEPLQTHTFYPSLTLHQIIPLPLTDLPAGSYQLTVTVDGGHPTLYNTDESFFEIRETNLVPTQKNEEKIQQVEQRVSWQWVMSTIVLLCIIVAGLLLLFSLIVGLSRNRRQGEARDEQLEKQLARLQLEQKSLAGSIGPMMAANWRLEQPKLKAALFLLQGGGVPEFIPILADDEYSSTTLGSGDRCTVRLWHRYIDDQHCLIRYESNRCFIRDGWRDQEPSTNGTFVNHEPVGWQERKLEDGDQIQLGLSVRYSFRTKRSDDALPTAAPVLAAPTPAMLLTLADPPAVATQPPPRQNP